MPNKTSRTVIVSFRLSVEDLTLIRRAMRSPLNRNTSVSDYCKTVVHRHVNRHGSMTYRDPCITRGGKPR